MTAYKIARHDLLELLTIAAQLGHEMDYSGTTRGDITARLERDMARQLAALENGAACGALVGPENEPCLKPHEHTEIAGEGWHSGIGWTTSRKS